VLDIIYRMSRQLATKAYEGRKRNQDNYVLYEIEFFAGQEIHILALDFGDLDKDIRKENLQLQVT
jgi:hypothetical protein